MTTNSDLELDRGGLELRLPELRGLARGGLVGDEPRAVFRRARSGLARVARVILRAE